MHLSYVLHRLRIANFKLKTKLFFKIKIKRKALLHNLDKWSMPEISNNFNNCITSTKILEI